MSEPRLAYIAPDLYWSTPFARWQGALANVHAFDLAAASAKVVFDRQKFDPARLDVGVLGTTVPQQSCFYGLPWLAAKMDAPHLAGPTVAQACATSARVIDLAAQEVALDAGAVLAITTDRISNGPHLYYPNPAGPGGSGRTENWVLDNFERDPHAKVAMVQTAENVARENGISTSEQHELVSCRYEQYAAACANDNAFLKRFMPLPFLVPGGKPGREKQMLGDEGIHALDPAKMATLKPVVDGGTVTYAAQTHPADGAAGMVICDEARAREFAGDSKLRIRLVATGQARTGVAMMPTAPVPAAEHALKRAGLQINDINVVKSHNPFIVNDIFFARHFRWDPTKMNNYGCSLVWGHPQGPTGMRAVIEMVEELILSGGGYGLFQGCAAGDTAMAVIVKVDNWS